MLVSAVSMNSKENFSSKGKDAFRALASEARGLGVPIEKNGESLKTLRAKVSSARTRASQKASEPPDGLLDRAVNFLLKFDRNVEIPRRR